jgi:transposase
MEKYLFLVFFQPIMEEAMAIRTQAYLAGNHTISSLIALYGLRSESTVSDWVRAYKKTIEDGPPSSRGKAGQIKWNTRT